VKFIHTISHPNLEVKKFVFQEEKKFKVKQPGKMNTIHVKPTRLNYH
jgi:hypothetical protein